MGPSKYNGIMIEYILSRFSCKKKDGSTHRLDVLAGAQISSRCYINKVVTRLKDTLDASNLEKFRMSCFGNFLEFQSNKFLSQLAFHVLKRMKDGYTQTAIFNINGMEVTLSPEDFFLITGLNFCGDTELPQRSDIHDHIFGGSEVVFLHNVEEAYASVSKYSSGRGQLTLKLGLVWFVYAVLFGRHPSQNKINLAYMHLVDDLDRFNSYPWGLKSYDFFIRKLCRARTILAKHDPASLSLDMYGMTFVLQVWLFERAPSLGNFCANRVEVAGPHVPRLFRWSVRRFRRFSTLKDYFGGLKTFGMVPIVPSSIEDELLQMQKPYFPVPVEDVLPHQSPQLASAGNVKDTDEIQSRYNLRSQHKAAKRNADHQGSGSTTIEAVSANEVNELGFGELKEILASVNVKLGFMVDYLSNSKRMRATKGVDMSEVDGLDDIYPDACGLAMGNNPRSCKLEPTNNGGCSDQPLSGVGVSNTNKYKSTINNGEVNATMTSSEWMNDGMDLFEMDLDVGVCKVPHTGTSSEPIESTSAIEVNYPNPLPSVTPSLVRRLDFSNVDMKLRRPGRSPVTDRSGCKKSSKHNPLACTSQTVVDNFNKWLDSANEDTSFDKVLLVPVAEGIEVHHGLLRNLRDPDKWISNVVCDAVLLSLVWKRKCNPDKFLSDWTVVDSYCSTKMMSGILDQASKALTPYVDGKMPTDDGRKWLEVDHVYGLALVNNSHWVAYDIQTHANKIIVYDSLTTANRWSQTKKAMEKLRHFVQFKMNIANAAAASTSKLFDSPWELIQFNNAPQQLNGDDCGVFALKFVECLMSGKPVSILTPSDGPKYRLGYCAMLYEIAIP